MHSDTTILYAIKEAKLLGLFKQFAERNKDNASLLRLRNLFKRTNNSIETSRNLIKNATGADLSDDEAARMSELIQAFLAKSTYRKPIDDSVKRSLSQRQNCKCAICRSDIDDNAHVDHIVPFKYVGDALDNNYQLLCPTCNLQKNASLDYQIRHMLNLVGGN